eukprot:jgi/Psemu1/209371/e_gw1.497.49.1
MAEAVLSSIISFLFPPKRGQSEDNPLPLKAVPGLITLLDVALFRSVEGQLTGTITTGHALLACWLDIKHQAQIVLQLYKTKDFIGTPDGEACPRESLAWQCLEASCNAIERLGTDGLAAAANLSDAYESTKAAAVQVALHAQHNHNHNHHGGSSGSINIGIGQQGIRNGVLLSKDETGRRGQLRQRRKDCWESPRLFCPDFVWADGVYLACRKWIRSLDKHPLVKISQESSPQTTSTSSGGGGGGRKRSARYEGDDPTYEEMETQIMVLVQLVQNDLPLRLYQFRSAMESEAVVTKRLYLVKCEYRAPFRAFLDAHQNLLRAPPMELVDRYLSNQQQSSNSSSGGKKGSGGHSSSSSSSSSPEALKAELQALLNTPELVELLALEMEAEKLELDMGKAFFPFTELARTLAHKKVYLEAVPRIVSVDELPVLRETVRRLGCLLCRKGGSETSTGIRPILLDLLLVPRDDEPISAAASWLSALVRETVSHNSNSNSHSNSHSHNSQHQQYYPALNTDLSLSVARGCTDDYDPELLKCQLLDWFAIVERQHALHDDDDDDYNNDIRWAEMKLSIAGASKQSLQTAKDSLKLLEGIRSERLNVLKDMVKEVCLREMNLCVTLTGPNPDEILELKETPSAKGLFGIPLELAGETLPIG